MNVSRNDLTSVLQRLFDHLGDANYDYGACADSVAWLEAHGLAGIQSLATVLEHLSANSHVPTEIVSSESEHFEINAGRQTLFALASVAIDLGVSMLGRSNPFRITIKNALNPQALVPAVHRAGRYPASVAGWWRASEEPTLSLVRGSEDGGYPQFKRFNLEDDDTHDPGIVTLVFTSDAEKLSALLPDTRTFDCLESVNADDFAERHARILDDGITVDESSFAVLCEVADRVLVSPTDPSRSGASE